MIRVLFVCLGNICRSPMAEAVFMNKVRNAGLTAEIGADSAGTGSWHVGKPPHQGVAQILKARGIPTQHKARMIRVSDLNEYDYVITMDDENWSDVLRMPSGTAKMARLMEFAPELGVREVPDPYHTGRFNDVYRLIEEACNGLLAKIRADLQV